MAEWNVSGDQMTIEPRRRRSVVGWLDDHRLRIAVAIGLVEAAAGFVIGVRYLWVVGLVAVFGYWWVRNRVPMAVRKPLWVLAMSQAIAGIAVPALFGAFFIAAIIGTLLLLMMILVMLGDLRRR